MSVHFYPISQKELSHCSYKVFVNGKQVALDTARVSAFPINRRWPGHQRPLDQSELINFLSLATDEALVFEIFPTEPFEKVKIRPQSLGIRPEITEKGSIRFTLPHPAYFVVETHERHDALHIFADPMPKYNVSPDDENVIYYGAGVHEVGQIELHEGQTLYLDEGAVVYACVTALDANNIKILGRGILDNSHNKEKILFTVEDSANSQAVANAERQHTVQLEYCTNVEIDGITVRDSLVYNIRPIGCRNITIKNVKIIGCWRYNSDGIDMHNCENVLVENCFVRTFDDAICVKGFDFYADDNAEEVLYNAIHHNGEVYDTFKNVRVRKCVIWNDWGKCLEIGAETRAEEITDIIFEDCDCIHIAGPVLDCFNVDYADAHGITWRNIRIELDEIIPIPQIQKADEEVFDASRGCYIPEIIKANVMYHPEYSVGGNGRRGRNRDLLYEDIYVIGDIKPIYSFCGYAEGADCRDITVRNVYWNGVKVTDPSQYEMRVLGRHCSNIKYETT